MYTSKIIKIIELAEKTLAIQLTKPSEYIFEAGQFFQIYIKDKNNNLLSRYFSICSAPADSILEFATRLTGSDFKQALLNKKIGDEIEFTKALGKFTLPENKLKPTVFLTGGIGITPFLSMLRELRNQGFDRKIYLFYSNKSTESTAYLKEIKEIANNNFELIMTMTNDPTWLGNTGYINEDIIIKNVDNFLEANYLIAGPPAMVKAMIELTKQIKITTNQVQSEEFSGY